MRRDEEQAHKADNVAESKVLTRLSSCSIVSAGNDARKGGAKCDKDECTLGQ